MEQQKHSGPSLELYCDSIGAGADVVILHGLFGSGENWRSQAKRLAADFRVHSMDLRNHGASPHASQMNYPAMAADVMATCGKLGLKQIHLIGHSMGGKTAMQLALNNPALVQRLIIVDIAPKKYPHHHQQILQGLARLQLLSQQNKLPSRGTADKELEAFVNNREVRSFLLKNLQRHESGNYLLRINLDAISEHYNDIAAAIEPDRPDPRQQPTLFIKGANSDYLQVADQEAVLTLFPAARLKSIAGAGHWPHSEKPDVVFKIIHDFLSGTNTK